MKDTKILAPKGTHDVLPDESYIWQDIESKMMAICKNFGYNEIRFPTFEHTELFNRGVGDSTDVVQNEMYTFNDKGDRSITLRPEGTASTVRSFIENSLYAQALPAKMCYLISCFRYERPQAGRFREFRQFGVENFGSNSPYTDAEVISLAMELLSSAGVKGLKLYINSIGCVECRKKYNEVLKNFLNSKKESLCGLCMDRIERNPLRVLDCKNADCQEILKDAPTVDSVLCDDCIKHFDTLKKALSDLDIDYVVDACDFLAKKKSIIEYLKLNQKTLVHSQLFVAAAGMMVLLNSLEVLQHRVLVSLSVLKDLSALYRNRIP